MARAIDGERSPTRLRLIVATVVAILTVLAVWKVIDYRSQPPPPPNPIGVPAKK
jgi:hypothetical protein